MAHLGSAPVLVWLGAHVTVRFTSTSSTDTYTGAPHSETRWAISTTAQSSSWAHRSRCGHQYSSLVSLMATLMDSNCWTIVVPFQVSFVSSYLFACAISFSLCMASVI